jgi:hypothetical protein
MPIQRAPCVLLEGAHRGEFRDLGRGRAESRELQDELDEKL